MSSVSSTSSTSSTSSGGAVTFSGLASGVDTASIIDSIIKVESKPKTLLEDKKTYLSSELDTYKEFKTLLADFNTAVSGLNNETDLNSYQVTNNGSDYFSVSTNSLAKEGTYAVKVVSLAQQQKDVSTNVIADTKTTSLSGELKIGDKTVSYSGVTLDGLVDLVNGKNYGVTASMIDEGSGSGYRLMMTADTSGDKIDITGTGSIILDTSTNGHTVEGSKAHVVVDGVDYYGTSNALTNAIKGATLTLQEKSDSAKNVVIKSDAEDVISTQLKEMISAYNDINSSIKTIAESDSTLANSMKSVQNSLKTYLTNKSLVSLGVSSDWETGKLSLDSDKYKTAYEKDPNAVKVSLFGDNKNGLMNRLDDYLGQQVDSSKGFYATKKNSIDKETKKLDSSITAMETRLEKRRKTLEAQYSAMETLVSSFKSQGDYITSFFNTYNKSS